MQLSLACLLDPSSRRRRRRDDDGDRRRRVEHMAVAFLLHCGEHSPEEIAVRHGISKVTVYRWAKLALAYDDPEAEGLRRLVADRD